MADYPHHMMGLTDVLEHRVVYYHSTHVDETVRMATVACHNVAIKRFFALRENFPLFVDCFKELRVLCIKFLQLTLRKRDRQRVSLNVKHYYRSDNHNQYHQKGG